ncbi:hypothetical protein L1887_57196 [Cichorium endivia]|nr:hypothetical protein L1887_57196 [Cichorium endivia]
MKRKNLGIPMVANVRVLGYRKGRGEDVYDGRKRESVGMWKQMWLVNRKRWNGNEPKERRLVRTKERIERDAQSCWTRGDGADGEEGKVDVSARKGILGAAVQLASNAPPSLCRVCRVCRVYRVYRVYRVGTLRSAAATVLRLCLASSAAPGSVSALADCPLHAWSSGPARLVKSIGSQLTDVGSRSGLDVVSNRALTARRALRPMKEEEGSAEQRATAAGAHLVVSDLVGSSPALGLAPGCSTLGRRRLALSCTNQTCHSPHLPTNSPFHASSVPTTTTHDPRTHRTLPQSSGASSNHTCLPASSFPCCLEHSHALPHDPSQRYAAGSATRWRTSAVNAAAMNSRRIVSLSPTSQEPLRVPRLFISQPRASARASMQPLPPPCAPCQQGPSSPLPPTACRGPGKLEKMLEDGEEHQNEENEIDEDEQHNKQAEQTGAKAESSGSSSGARSATGGAAASGSASGSGSAAGGSSSGSGNGSGSNSLARSTVPSVYPQVLALPITRRPLFPGFYKAVVIKNQAVCAAIKESLKRGQPYIGAFLLKDEAEDADVHHRSQQGPQGRRPLPRSPASSPSRAAAIPAEPRRARTAKMPKKRRASLPSFTRTAASASTNSSLPPVRPSLRPHQAPRAPAQPIPSATKPPTKP